MLLGRLPSFFEPHWYTDEAGYTTTAQALLNGKILYAGIWNNKPPLHLWTVALVFRLFGPSEAGLHLLTLIAGLVTLAAVMWVAPQLMGRRATAVVVLGCALLLATPVLDAELALPETLLAAPAAWGGALLLAKLHDRSGGRRDRGLWPLAVGALAAVAIAYQQTALADAMAFGLVLLISPLVSRREVALYAVAVIVPTLAWLLAVIALAGGHNVAFALAGFYIPYTQSAIPSHGAGRLVYLAGLALAGLLAIAGACLRRREGVAWAAVIWAVFALLVPAAAQQPYPHFLLPSLVPVALALPQLLQRDWLRGLTPARVGAGSLAVALLLAGLMARGAGLDWIPPLSGTGYNGYRTLTTYYADPVGFLITDHSLQPWQDKFDDRVAGDRAVAAWVKQNHLTGSTAVVWSSDAWLYATAGLAQVMPTAPIYNDFVLLGMDGQVSGRVRQLAPELIIVADQDSDEFPEIQPVLVDSYHPVYVAGHDTVWMRLDLGTPST
jgi:4-amino-4-deoxy-L-arabinose transferase-like glycosyltransferase